MDNRLISVQSSGYNALSHAVSLLWEGAPGGVATHWAVLPPGGTPEQRLRVEAPCPTLVLFWSRPESGTMKDNQRAEQEGFFGKSSEDKTGVNLIPLQGSVNGNFNLEILGSSPK